MRSREWSFRAGLGVAGAAVLAVTLLLALSGPAAGGGPRPNVILVTVDTLRADHLGSYGYERPTSPVIDRLSREALRFERCFAQSSETRSSMAALLSGFFPHETLVARSQRLSPALETLPEILRQHGYATAAVVSNYVLKEGSGFGQGFDLYDDTMTHVERNRKAPERIAEDTTARAVEVLDGLGDGPFFLWVHYQDPHGPYTPPRAIRELFDEPGREAEPLPVNDSISGLGGIPDYQQLGRQRDYHHYVDAYDGEIRYLDQQFGRLLAALDERGHYDEALLVFTADHGEALGEHDQYFAHMRHLYSHLTHVPLLLRHGERWQGERADPVQHVDVLPTLLAVLGIEVDLPLRGRALLQEEHPAPRIFGTIVRPDVPGGARHTLVEGDFRLVHSVPEDRYELYDLRSDPGEQHDLAPLAGEDPGLAARLAAMAASLARLERSDRLRLDESATGWELDEEERRALESLGYVR